MFFEYPQYDILSFKDPDPKDFALTVKFQFSTEDEIYKYKFGEILLTRDLITLIAGEKSEINQEKLRKLGGFLAKFSQAHQVKTILINQEDMREFSHDQILAFFEGLFLGNYSFNTFKQEDQDRNLNIFFPGADDYLINAVQSKHEICKIINYARTIGQLPGNVINPVSLAELCQTIGESNGLKVSVLDEKDLDRMGAHAILAVGKGSKSKPRMIILEYSSQPDKTDNPIVLVGKAITFDTGGYSIKPVDGIKTMKFDKLGGITVLGTMLAAAKLKLNKNIVGVICAAENMISDDAYRPDDIIKTLSGKTVEILSTDAEGRLVLADGITYAQKNYKPACIIDFATLTGGIVVALGKIRAGLFSNNQELSEQLFNSGESTYEKLWRMPLDDEYFEFIKGDDADLKNAGGREGHPIMGAIFLKQFVENEIPWAHIDIAGAATSTKSEHYLPKGATGFGIRLMLDFLANQ